MLVYTVAVDSPGSFLYRNLAKLLASSIIRSGFEGDVVIFHNSHDRLFPLGRPNISEEFIEVIESEANSGFTLEAKRWSLKIVAGTMLLEKYEWEKLFFIDADCLVTDSLTQIFQGNWDLTIYREIGVKITNIQFNGFLTDEEKVTLACDGINSGVFGISRSIAQIFFELWRSIEQRVDSKSVACMDQAALNRIALDLPCILRDISDQISMPFHTDRRTKTKTITHFVGAMEYQKLKASFGLYMETYFFDSSLTLFHLLEN